MKAPLNTNRQTILDRSIWRHILSAILPPFRHLQPTWSTSLQTWIISRRMACYLICSHLIAGSFCRASCPRGSVVWCADGGRSMVNPESRIGRQVMGLGTEIPQWGPKGKAPAESRLEHFCKYTAWNLKPGKNKIQNLMALFQCSTWHYNNKQFCAVSRNFRREFIENEALISPRTDTEAVEE